MEALRDCVPEEQMFSAGVASWETADSCDDLIARADNAMYVAKSLGRDRVVASPPKCSAPDPVPSPAAAC